ncbi:sigma-70 family RNA polymerase sigma factor [Streptomyces sp. NBS 14/10]|uniref:RNA polymerase sigma factor n=1 Tax=Streptomyces sp. NBS 14/10 TaxID=1945643 RepID=UPI000B7E3960|nr:sigma-70 family RNA polymerase sigma factor [Streptomyces sp. NBS 14/10]KAK1182474.1 sigma-70 family RNA polymerase sigma factor [Streptomyces sp. NBS 14/10]
MSAPRSDTRSHGEAGGGDGTSPVSLACFEAFARNARPALVRAARRYVPDHTADDVAQNVLESIFKKWDRVVIMDHPVGYAVTVARSRAIDQLRQQQREFPVASEELAPLIEEGRLRGTSSDDVDVLELMQSLVKGISGRAGQVLQLSLLGYTHQEIAEFLRVSPSTVRVLLHRARRQLKASDEVRSLTRATHLINGLPPS